MWGALCLHTGKVNFPLGWRILLLLKGTYLLVTNWVMWKWKIWRLKKNTLAGMISCWIDITLWINSVILLFDCCCHFGFCCQIIVDGTVVLTALLFSQPTRTGLVTYHSKFSNTKFRPNSHETVLPKVKNRSWPWISFCYWLNDKPRYFIFQNKVF